MSNDLEFLYDDAMTALGEEDIDAAIELLDEMVAEAADDPRTIEVQGDVARFQGEVEQSEQHYQRLLEQAPDNHWRGIAHYSLGTLFGMAEEHDLVVPHLQQAIDCFQAGGEAFKVAEVHTALAIYEQERGNFQVAVDSLEIARELIQQDNDDGDLEEQLATACQLLGTMYRLVGKLDRAKVVLGEALQRFDDLGDQVECANTLDALGVIEQIQGQYDQAEQLHLKALGISQAIEYEEGMSINFGNLTMLNINRRQFDDAADWAQRSYEIDAAQGNDNGVAHFHLMMGEIECERGQLDKAEEHLRECDKLYEECGDAEDKLCVLGKLAFLHLKRGELEKASQLGEQALETVEKMDHADGLAAALAELAEIRLAQGRSNDAKELWERSLEVYQQLSSARMIKEIRDNLAKLT